MTEGPFYVIPRALPSSEMQQQIWVSFFKLLGKTSFPFKHSTLCSELFLVIKASLVLISETLEYSVCIYSQILRLKSYNNHVYSELLLGLMKNGLLGVFFPLFLCVRVPNKIGNQN